MLDTNTLGDLVDHPRGRVARRIRAVGASNVRCSTIVVSELRFGAAKRGSSRLTDIIDGVLARVEVVALGPPADRVYANLRAALSRAGTPIGPNDMFIAAHALAEGDVLVTAVGGFSRVTGLALENWLSDETP